jgi:hypothetical protein
MMQRQSLPSLSSRPVRSARNLPYRGVLVSRILGRNVCSGKPGSLALTVATGGGFCSLRLRLQHSGLLLLRRHA